MVKKKDSLLIIFTRNPELGRCKTRLAKTIGDISALKVYTILLKHTVLITEELAVEKEVHYSDKVVENDIWNESNYSKKKQEGDDLGGRMKHAFEQGFTAGFEKIVIIGSDIYDLRQSDLEKAFLDLETCDIVIGPAEDGGYYLLGMKQLNTAIFSNKNWGAETVFQETMMDLKETSVAKLNKRNDIDVYEDIMDIDIFQEFLRD